MSGVMMFLNSGDCWIICRLTNIARSTDRSDNTQSDTAKRASGGPFAGDGFTEICLLNTVLGRTCLTICSSSVYVPYTPVISP